MLSPLASFTFWLFILTTLFTGFALLNTAAPLMERKPYFQWLGILVAWLAIQAWLAFDGFYLHFEAIPPRFLLAIGPPLLLILYGLVFRQTWVRALSLKSLTYIHLIRVPVEITLYRLFLEGYVPQLMTFEGANPDILAGITAPLVGVFAFRLAPRTGKTALIVWHFLALGLLLNIVIRAVLSAPLPFQQMAFDQPNIAVFHFPFIWLPSTVVPIVLFSHLAALSQLLGKKAT